MTTVYSPGATGSTTVTVTRYGATTLVRGQPVLSTSTFQITDANIQPASKEDLMRLTEGQRQKDVQIIFTATELRSAGMANNAKSDRITFDGKDYEIFFVNTYKMGVLNHTEAIMVEVTNA